MAKKLFVSDGIFFSDIPNYVGKSPVFVDSLLTANSVADPDDVIEFLKTSGMFEEDGSMCDKVNFAVAVRQGGVQGAV